MSSRVRAVLVEDSPTQLAHLIRVLERDHIKVVGEATSAPEGVAAVQRHHPDVVVMDLDIPGGGGQHAIEQIMERHPVPILVLSGMFTERAAAPAVDALAAGAVEVLPKPQRWDEHAEVELQRLVRMVAGVRVVRRRGAEGTERLAPPGARRARPGQAVVGVVASTGGPGALVELLTELRPTGLPVLVVQHIHATFVKAFAEWLERACGLPVCVAADGQALEQGRVYMAPSGRHLLLEADRRLALHTEPQTLHHPSGDVMLASLAGQLGARAIGVVLTGMGSDGARGLLAIRRAGGRTFAQDEASSTVFGMPRAAQIAGATDTLLSPARIGAAIAGEVTG